MANEAWNRMFPKSIDVEKMVISRACAGMLGYSSDEMTENEARAEIGIAPDGDPTGDAEWADLLALFAPAISVNSEAAKIQTFRYLRDLLAMAEANPDSAYRDRATMDAAMSAEQTRRNEILAQVNPPGQQNRP